MKLEKNNLDNILETREREVQIEIIANVVLEKENAKTPETALSGGDIFKEYESIRKNNPKYPLIPQNTFNIYLSKIADSDDSKINCKGRKQGYYIDLVYEQIDEQHQKVQLSIDENPVVDSKKGHVLEKDLYPLLKDWLLRDNKRVADVSSYRAQGKWANPDIVGVKTDDLFGETVVEITTIEAKTTPDNWEQWIFEAVAHTIFSNRSYFAFTYSEDHIHKLPSDIKHYAEVFRIGILIIKVSQDDFIKIQKKEKFEINSSNSTVQEYVPAPYHAPHIKFKKKFLQGLGIMEKEHLYNFGQTII
jgi:hypothetical protein